MAAPIEHHSSGKGAREKSKPLKSILNRRLLSWAIFSSSTEASFMREIIFRRAFIEMFRRLEMRRQRCRRIPWRKQRTFLTRNYMRPEKRA